MESERQTTYNQVAIETAQQLGQARQSIREQRTETKPREQLFPAFNRTGLGLALEYERMGNQPVSDSLLNQAEALGASFEHLGVTIGTIIHGVDLKQAMSPELTQFVRSCLLERKVIFFRDQYLDEDQQVRFAEQFGSLDAFPFGKPGENPYVLQIVHGPEAPGTENGWHTDVTWMEQPSLGSVAQLIKAPPVGGDTLFSDSHAAYLGMTEQLKDRVEHLDAIHDYRIFLTERSPGELPVDLVDDIKRQIPFGVSHPILRTHPETGKTALYIHGGFIRHDSLHDRRTGEYLEPEESVSVVRELLAQHARPEYTCRFHWEEGSIAFWDNRAVQHYAASDYYPHERMLRRVTISGDKPYYRSSV